MRRIHGLVILTALACLGSTRPAHADRLDDLVAALAGPNEEARSLARQLLPREGVAAVPKLLPLVENADPRVWNAAFQTLSDIANEVSAPGRDTERAAVAAHLMSLVGPEKSFEVKKRGLRLLPIVVPDTFDIGPVARLLDDPELREKARVVLEEMGAASARAALRGRLATADPAFKVAILNALGRLKDAEGVDAIRALAEAKDGDPAVRVAAVRALSWTGDPRDSKTAQQVATAAAPADRPEALDALIRQLRAIERDPKLRALAFTAYADLLESSDGVTKDGALAGLGRVGDAKAVPIVLSALRQAEPPTLLVGLDALRSMRGDDVTRALVEAFPRLDPGLKARLLPVLGARRGPAVVPILSEAARSTDEATRRSAIEGLAESTCKEGLDQLLSLDPKEVPAGPLIDLAGRFREPGHLGQAATAYAAALSRAANDSEATRALEGLAVCPRADAETAASVKKAAARAELRKPALRALLATAAALTAKGRKEQAVELYETVRGLDPPVELIRELVKGMTDAGSSADLRGLLGTVVRWHVIGPFELGEKNAGWDTAHVGEPNVDMVARFMTGKRRAQWDPVVSSEPTGRIDLRKTVGNRDNCVGYAYAEIVVDKPTDAVLLLGVDDSERIWVNGKKVFEHFTARGFIPDQDRVPVRLVAGVNTILLKIYQNTMGWEFCLRIVDPTGRPVPFEQKAE